MLARVAISIGSLLVVTSLCACSTDDLAERLAALESQNLQLRQQNAAVEAAREIAPVDPDFAGATTPPIEPAPEPEGPLRIGPDRTAEEEAAAAEAEARSAAVFALFDHFLALPQSNAYLLRDTAWTVEIDGESGRIEFSDTYLITNRSDGTQALALADFGGSWPECQGPNCVLVYDFDGAIRVQHFHLDEEQGELWPVQCLDWNRIGVRGLPPPADIQFRERSGMTVVYHDEMWDRLCLRDVEARPYRRAQVGSER